MKFIRQTITVIGGAAGGHLVILLATPWLARAYPAVELGRFAVFTAVFGVVLTFSAARYEFAIPAATDQDIVPITGVGLLAAVASGIGLVLATSFGVLQWVFPDTTQLDDLALLSGFAAVLGGWHQVGIYHGVRRGRFGLNVLLRLSQPLSFVTVAFYFRSASLVVAYLIGYLVAAAIALLTLGRGVWTVSGVDLRAAANRYRIYPFSLPAAALDAIALSLPLVFVATTYGLREAGNVSQVQRVVAAPLLLAGVAVGQVFFKHAADRFRAGKSFTRLMGMTASGMAGGGTVLVLLTACCGEPVVRLLLGSQWRTDALFCVLLLLPVVFRMAVHPISAVFFVCDRMRFAMLWQLMYFLVIVGVLDWARGSFDLDGFLVTLLVTDSVMYGIYLALAFYATHDAAARAATRVSRASLAPLN